MKKVISLLLTAVMIFGMVACGTTSETNQTPEVEIAGQNTPEQTPTGNDPTPENSGETEPVVPTDYVRADGAVVFEDILGEYQALLSVADATQELNERYVRFAMAEAALLDAAVARPYSNNGYTQCITRIAPHTMAVLTGVEQNIYVSAVVSSDIITAEEYDEMTALWEAAAMGNGVYDAAAYLTEKGHTVQNEIVAVTNYTPQTLDIHGTLGSELELFCNTEMTLLANDSHGNLIPWLAEDYSVSADGLTYIFNLRKGVKWYTAEGQVYGEVTAEDFVAGMRHFLDVQVGTQSNCDSIVGAFDYYANGGSWDDVGIKAVDEYTVEITLAQPTPYFLSLCTYLYFRPLCKSFYEAHGGAFGVQEYAEAAASGSYNYGLASDISTQLYCGPYRLTKLVAGSEFKIEKNESFFAADSMTVNSVTFVFDDGSVPVQTAQAFLDGTYATCYPMEGNGTMELLAGAGYADAIHIGASSATSYLLLNLNRGSFNGGDDGVSVKNDDLSLQISAQQAMWNNNFRKALFCAMDAAVLNAVESGEALAQSLCRNTSTPGAMVSIDKDVTVDGYTFKAGTTYGQMVQFFADERGLDVNLEDGQDGWYNVDKAKAYIEAAKAELGDSISWPIHVDILIPDAGYGSYYIPRATAIKQTIEDSIGDYVVVDLLITDTMDAYYLGLSGAEAINTDILYYLIWGVLFQDPIEPLRIFQGYGAGVAGMYMGLF